MIKDQNGDFARVLDEVCGSRNREMVLVFVKERRGDTYGIIKKKTLEHWGVPSQVFLHLPIIEPLR